MQSLRQQQDRPLHQIGMIDDTYFECAACHDIWLFNPLMFMCSLDPEERQIIYCPGSGTFTKEELVEEKEWLDIVSKPQVQAALRTMAEQARKEIKDRDKDEEENDGSWWMCGDEEDRYL